MIALLTRNYLQSKFCRRELASMLARADWLRQRGEADQIIFPLAVRDCAAEDLPEALKALQILSIHDYADPFMHPESMLREQLSRRLQPLCEQVARRIEQIEDDTFLWPPPMTRSTGSFWCLLTGPAGPFLCLAAIHDRHVLLSRGRASADGAAPLGSLRS